jgi:hypothetical protein
MEVSRIHAFVSWVQILRHLHYLLMKWQLVSSVMRSVLFLFVYRLRRRLQNPMSQNPTGSHQDLATVSREVELAGRRPYLQLVFQIHLLTLVLPL